VPVKLRTRKERRPFFGDEVLDLFRRLDAEHMRDEAWQRDSRRLAAMLGAEFEDAWFLGGLDVLDPRLAEYHPPGFWGGDPWIRVQEMRAALLAAAKVH
jgi:hypothetical protein